MHRCDLDRHVRQLKRGRPAALPARPLRPRQPPPFTPGHRAPGVAWGRRSRLSAYDRSLLLESRVAGLKSGVSRSYESSVLSRPVPNWIPELTVRPAPARLPDVVSSAFHRVEEDAMKAVAYFNTWWACRNSDDLDHAAIVTNGRLVDFLTVCGSGLPWQSCASNSLQSVAFARPPPLVKGMVNHLCVSDRTCGRRCLVG